MSGRGAHPQLHGSPTRKRGRDGNLDPDTTLHHGGSFKVYMQHKNLRLQEQFEAQQLQQEQLSHVFAGVSIHVNGYTVPSHQVGAIPAARRRRACCACCGVLCMLCCACSAMRVLRMLAGPPPTPPPPWPNILASALHRS